MDKKLLDILACPSCKSGLKYLKEEQELVCVPCRLAYAVRDDIPIMLIDEARQLTADEAEELR
ncbi:MAG: Trm112 family protein [Cycloclasticus sp.]